MEGAEKHSREVLGMNVMYCRTRVPGPGFRFFETLGYQISNPRWLEKVFQDFQIHREDPRYAEMARIRDMDVQTKGFQLMKKSLRLISKY